VAAATVGGVVLATPVALLELASARERLVIPLDGVGAVQYSYVHSVFGARVQEEYVPEGGGLRLRTVRTADRRAIEYLGWEVEPRREAGLYVAEPPEGTPLEFPQTVRVTKPARQEIAVDGQRVELEARFGEELVRIRRTISSRAAWLLSSIGR
jgi:hypothetical protein